MYTNIFFSSCLYLLTTLYLLHFITFFQIEQFQVENENLQAEDLAIAHAKAQQEANYQRAALETSKRAALEAEINAQQRLGDATGSSAGTKMDMNGMLSNIFKNFKSLKNLQ